MVRAVDDGHFPVVNSYPTLSVAVDFDGTIAPDALGMDFGEPHAELGVLLRRLQGAGVYVVVHSARPPAHHPAVVAWLLEHDFPHDQVALGAKPAVDLFIDDKGLLPPLRALEDLWWWRVQGRDPMNFTKGAALGPLDEQMTACWENDEAPPVPEGLAEAFRVVVPVSGGLDSTVCWLMALEAGLPVQPVFVDTGATYINDEWRAVQQIADRLGQPVRRVNVPYGGDTWLHNHRARNAVIVLTLAQLMRTGGWWGEVWFGNLGEVNETPIYGGDKSHRWFLDVNQLLTLDGHDVRVVSPLGALSKTDAARWAAERGHAEVLLMTRSCYEAGDRACLSCLCCFRREFALMKAGLLHDFDGRVIDPGAPSFEVWRDFFAAELAKPRAATEVTWSPARVAELAEWLRRQRPSEEPG